MIILSYWWKEHGDSNDVCDNLSDLNYLNTRSSAENKNSLTYCDEPYIACQDSHAIAVITEWDEFKSFDWERIYQSMMKPEKVFDGRNILDVKSLEKIGFEVYSIGK